MKARFEKYTLQFKQASGTSRGVLHTKDTYFIYIEKDGEEAVGEAALFKGLSADDVLDYESVLAQVCTQIEEYLLDYKEKLRAYPSILFGLEQALLKLENGGVCFDNNFTKGQQGIPINGLIWMGDEHFMLEQIEHKIKDGYKCLKMKIGAIDFYKELAMLKSIRKRFSKDEMELRVDANGAFDVQNVFIRLDELSKVELHSIEQPIKAGQVKEMSKICAYTPLPVALDEELIGVFYKEDKEKLLRTIMPQFIILKPALHGGFSGCDEWISIAESLGIKWWITSALESNIGLEAIAQYTASKNTDIYQGLGTGQLFTNNIESTLQIRDAKLWAL